MEDAVSPLGSVLPFSRSTCLQWMAGGWGQMKVTLAVSSGHGSVLIWLTFPAEPWPQASPAFCTGSLAPMMVSFAPRPVEGLLHLPASPFCILPFLPSIFDLTILCRQHIEHSHRSSQPMIRGFVKYCSTEAWQGNDGGGGTRSSPCALQNGCWVCYGIYLKEE